MNKAEVLERGIELITGDREKNYGSTHTNFSRIAALWSVVLDYDVDPHQVALCLAQLKVARLIETSNHKDSWCDGVGYLAIGAELATGLPMAEWERELLHAEEAPQEGSITNLNGYRIGTVVEDRDGFDWEKVGPRWWVVSGIAETVKLYESSFDNQSTVEQNWGPFTLVSGGFEEPNVPKVGDWISTEEELASLPVGSQLGIICLRQDRASNSTDAFWQKYPDGWASPEGGGVGTIPDAFMAGSDGERLVLRVGAA